jgi:predicted NUDIX family NTP pyrophosphohydrolase
MASESAGILLYRRGADGIEMLLVHPGGPFWARRDAGAWSIPKGEPEPGEDRLEAARREFAEELGSPPPDGPAIELGEARLRSGKRVLAWALEGDFDPGLLRSNTCQVEWPPRSGRLIDVPEVDRAEWCSALAARKRLNPAQVSFVERLESVLEGAVARSGSR